MNRRYLPLLILPLFFGGFSNVENPNMVKADSGDINVYLGNFNNIKDIYYKNDDSLQLGASYVGVKVNGNSVIGTAFYDATSNTSSGTNYALTSGAVIELSFENAAFNNYRTLEEISLVFSTSALKVDYDICYTNGGSSYTRVISTETPLAEKTSYESFHNLTNLHVDNKYKNVYKIRFTISVMDSSISNFSLKEIDLELYENPSAFTASKDQKNLDIKVPKIFSDHALLKHQTNTKVYGYGGGADNNHIEIYVKKDNQTISHKTAIVRNYQWSTELDKIAAGLGYTLEFVGPHNTLTFTDIAFGEVYLVSGQSNMQRTMEKLDGATDEDYIWPNYATEILNPLKTNPNNNLRLFNQSGESLRNQRIVDVNSDGWSITDFDSAYHFSAVGYFFGDALQKSLEIPVGLIYAAVGGSKIQEWLDKNMLMASTDTELATEQEKCQTYYEGYLSAHSTYSTGNYFNSMIRPLGNYSISGVAWYQGESNAGARKYYHKLMDILERSYKSIFDNDDLTFLVCQIAPYNVSGYNHHYIANMQAEMQYVLPNTYTTVIYDTVTEPNYSNIHPQNKKPVGERLANLAREVIYGEDIEAMCPFVSEVEFDHELAILVFDHVGRGFDTSEELKGFEVSGDGTTFYKADAVIMGNMVICCANQVNNVVAVRYAYDRCFSGNLKTVDGLPASIFASDVVILPLSTKREIKTHTSTKQAPLIINSGEQLPSTINVVIDDENKEVNVIWDDVELHEGVQIISGHIDNPCYLRVTMKVTLISNANLLVIILPIAIGGGLLLGVATFLLIYKLKKNKRRISS